MTIIILAGIVLAVGGLMLGLCKSLDDRLL